MFRKKEKPRDNSRLQEILAGVDATGTIVYEDLGEMRKCLADLQAEIAKIREDLNILRLTGKGLEDNQQEILETIALLAAKIDHLEVRLFRSLPEPAKNDSAQCD